jgi:hypothetical protein
MLLLGWIVSHAPRLIKCMKRFHCLLYIFLDLGVLLSCCLDLLAMVRVAPTPSHPHVFPVSLIKDLDY